MSPESLPGGKFHGADWLPAPFSAFAGIPVRECPWITEGFMYVVNLADEQVIYVGTLKVPPTKQKISHRLLDFCEKVWDHMFSGDSRRDRKDRHDKS